MSRNSHSSGGRETAVQLRNFVALSSNNWKFREHHFTTFSDDHFLLLSYKFTILSGFGGLEVACWPLVPGYAGSHPGEAVGFLGRKNAQHALLEVKPSVLCRSFTACKRSLNVTSKSAFRQNYRTFLAHSSTFRRWVFSRSDTRGDAWWRKLERLTQIAQ